jgi:hypothetical protein
MGGFVRSPLHDVVCAGVTYLAKPESVVKSPCAIGSDDLNSEGLACATSLIEQVLNYDASNSRASISRQQRYVNAANLVVAALDHHPPNREAIEKNDVVVGSRVLCSVRMLLPDKLHLEQHLLLRGIPLSRSQVFIARATVEIIQKRLIIRARGAQRDRHVFGLSQLNFDATCIEASTATLMLRACVRQ